MRFHYQGWNYFKDWINYIGFLLFVACSGFLVSFRLHGHDNPTVQICTSN